MKEKIEEYLKEKEEQTQKRSDDPRSMGKITASEIHILDIDRPVCLYHPQKITEWGHLNEWSLSLNGHD